LIFGLLDRLAKINGMWTIGDNEISLNDKHNLRFLIAGMRRFSGQERRDYLRPF